MRAYFSFLSLVLSIASSQTTIWTDPLTFSSAWTTTNTAISSTGCRYSAPCLNIRGSGGVASTTIDTTSYESIQLQFYLSVNLDTNDLCEVYYKLTSSTSYTFLTSYSSNPASPTTLPLTADTADTSIDIRFVNTGKQTADACYLDQVSILGTAIVVPTPMPTTAAPTTPTTTTAAPTTKTSSATPTARPTSRPTSYSSASGGGTDEDYRSEVNFFSSWQGFGIYVGCITGFGCFAFCPWFILIYLWVKNTVVNMIGVDTTGTVLNKRIRIRRSKRSTTYTYLIDYKYTVRDHEYFDEQRVSEPDDWNMIQQGTIIPVKYLGCYPAVNMKEHGSGQGCCYCSVFCNCCIWAIMAAGICVAGFIVTSLFATNSVDLMILILFGTVVFCAIPCCFCGAANDRAHKDKPKQLKVIRPCPDWCYNSPRYHDNLPGGYNVNGAQMQNF